MSARMFGRLDGIWAITSWGIKLIYNYGRLGFCFRVITAVGVGGTRLNSCDISTMSLASFVNASILPRCQS